MNHGGRLTPLAGSSVRAFQSIARALDTTAGAARGEMIATDNVEQLNAPEARSGEAVCNSTHPSGGRAPGVSVGIGTDRY